MWKSGFDPGAALLFSVDKNEENRKTLHRRKEKEKTNISLFDNPQKIVEEIRN
ncbi:MAG: hypothetical protein IJK35_00250 [Oscillospiraceae bacterium]|nr:hypothetical protein [Oscillospiraceae bacterium]